VATRTNKPFVDEVPRLLAESGLSLRQLAAAAGTSAPHLSRVLRGADYKTPSGTLAEAVAKVFGLPPDYFPEARMAALVETLAGNAKLRDELFDKHVKRRLRR
jgi:transcriptional regulator with XRE-family HTH domain